MREKSERESSFLPFESTLCGTRAFLLALTLCGMCHGISPQSSVDADMESQLWYTARDTWTLTPYTKEQNNYITNLVKVNRLKDIILPHILVVRPPGSSGSQYVRRIITILMKNYLKWDIEEDSFSATVPGPYGVTKFTNVIATLNPGAKRRLVLACHYDSKVTPKNFLGAIDSAVPCSMMIELAISLHNLLDSSPLKDELTLQFIFFDGEEAFVQWSMTDSLYGSTHLAQKWQETRWPQNDPATEWNQLDSIDLLMLLDLLGAANPRFYNSYVVESAHFSDLIRIEKALYGHNLYFRGQTLGTFAEDDHLPFYLRGVPILHVMPTPFPRQWHTPQDDAAHLNRYAIERLTKIFAVFVSEYLRLKVP